MAYLRIKPDYDTCINLLFPTTNAGYSQVVQVDASYDSLKNKKQLVRTLMHFDIESLTSNSRIMSGSYTANLHMYDCRATDPFTSDDIDINIYALTKQWSEGRGVDLNFRNQEGQGVTGCANWLNATRSTAWTSSGATSDINTSYSATSHYTTGYEDMFINITTLVSAWANNIIPNYGMLIKLADTFEDLTGGLSGTFINNKRFHGGNSHTFLKPYIEILSTNDQIKDDRNAFEIMKPQYITLMNRSNGVLETIESTTAAAGRFDGTINIYENGSTAVLTSISAAEIMTGIYQGIFQYDGTNSKLHDVWSVTGNSIMPPLTGDIYVLQNNLSTRIIDDVHIVPRVNIKKQYLIGETIDFKVYFSSNKYIMSLTGGTDDIAVWQKYYPKTSYIEFRDAVSDYSMYGKELLSYNEEGFFTSVDTNDWIKNRSYVPVLYYTIGGKQIIKKFTNYNFYVRA
jgi:hypothetical protein